MADMVLGSTQGAVDSLLGRLTSALAGEAQLLSGVRSDMQFIKDEMESMNGFLKHIAETGKGESDHQVRAWMKQVADVAYRSQNCVDLYVKSLGLCTTAAGQKGICGYLRRLPQMVKTLPMRHRIATQIRELKIRAEEVGQRRLRYGVEVPVNGGRSNNSVNMTTSGADDSGVEEGIMAWAEIEPASFESFTVKTWIQENGDGTKLQKHGIPRVIALVGDNEETAHFARVALEDPWLTSTCSLDRKEWIQVGHGYDPDLLAQRIQKKLSGQPDDELSATDDHLATGDDSVTYDTIIRKHRQLVDSLMYSTATRAANFLLYVVGIINPRTLVMKHLQQKGKGKRFLLVLHDVQDTSIWDRIKSVFSDSNWSPDSAILVTTQDVQYAYPFIPYEIYILESIHTELYNYSNYIADFYLDNKAIVHQGTHLKPVLKEIFKTLCRQISECKLFIYALSANPNRSQAELQTLRDNLHYASPNNHKEMLKFIYKGMSNSCRDCMLYLSIFHGRATIKRGRLLRRWVAEGMVTKRGRLSTLDEAKQCFDVLVAHGCVIPGETDVTGKVKSYVIHDLVTEIARDENFVLDNLSPGLAHRLSIRSAFELQQGAQKQYATHSKGSWKFNRVKKTSQPETDESNAIKVFFKSLPSSPELRLLEVLDLEDCKELRNSHLKSICDNVFKLKYLSIRRTDITELPKQLGELLFLETLDIRQTKIETLTKGGYVVLPKLKYLLATRHNDCRNHESNPEESFFTVKMPKNVGGMTELQVLSHMEVSGEGDELEHMSVA
ncbi:hypothetical protein QOZ80_9BG0713720 [Eleusine coracana subsp. coracana]|nr:hypothetical protein QOZ80_9BG0713720 [Eleusine coracana subsp. coracana]